MKLLSWVIAIEMLCTGCLVGDAPPNMPPDMPPNPDPEPTTRVLESVSGGSFHPLGVFTNIAGRAIMVRKLDGTTLLSMTVTGVQPTIAYTAHVHVAPCASLGGGHYKLDPTITTASEANELWLRGISTANGALAVDAKFSHRTRGEALAIVLHDPQTGSKMACADLLGDDPSTLDIAGSVASYATNAPADRNITGMVHAMRGATATAFDMSLSGLDPAALGYVAHVYGEPCGVAAGGDPYKLDPAMTTPAESNEIALPVTMSAAGTSAATLAVPHAIRSDAQAIVIERNVTATTTARVACASLTRMTEYGPLESEGTATPLAAATGLSLTGSAVLTRKLTGITVVAVVMTGLAPNVSYQAHLHAQPCSAAAGGGHYKIDRAGSGPDNEVGFDLTADATGAAYDSTWFHATAAADAASVVLHGVDGARLACFDLE